MLEQRDQCSAEAFEQVSVYMFLEGEDKPLPAGISTSKIDLNAIHRYCVLPVLNSVITLKLCDE
jgi:hypothetical protein